MNVAVIVATFGDESWRAQGEKTAAEAAVMHDVPVYPVHDVTLADARNKGGEQADAEWLCFLDADDALQPGYFDAMANFSGYDEHADTEWLNLYVPMVQYVTDGVAEMPRDLNDGRPLIEVNHAVIGTLISKQLFTELHGFGDEPIYEDWALWLRAERAGATLHDVVGAVYIATRRRRSRNLGPSPAFAQGWYWRIRRTEEAARQALAR